MKYQFTYFYSDYAQHHCIGINIPEQMGINIQVILQQVFKFKDHGCEVMVGNYTSNYEREFNFIISSYEKDRLIMAEKIFQDVVKQKYGEQ
ncbi:hypothetical protein SDC9_185889 [bioreactor metagenome]|uniref:Uncharacterized protein n=1 Tax=bioreactor metagenome TaxID=1076179 RepID=A0A645HH47_9ZZZZ